MTGLTFQPQVGSLAIVRDEMSDHQPSQPSRSVLSELNSHF